MRMKSKIMQICIVTVLLLTVILTCNNTYAVAEEELNLGLTLWRQNDDNYYKNNHYINQDKSIGVEVEGNLVGYVTGESHLENEGATRIWKIVEQSGTNLDYSKSIYCLKAGVGFTSLKDKTTTESSVKYDKKLNMLNSENKAKIIKLLKIDEATYNKILWIIDKIYIPSSDSATVDRETLLTDSGVKALVENYKQSLKETEGLSDEEVSLLDITDNDIDVVQQMALWYYTNGVEYATDTLQSLKTAYKDTYEEVTGLEFENFTDQYNYTYVNEGDPIQWKTALGEWRQNLCEKLFDYLVDNADENFNLTSGAIKTATFCTNSEDYTNINNIASGSKEYSVQPVVIVEKEEKEFDLALRKFITHVSDGTYKNTYYRVPEITAQQIQKLANGDIKTVEKTHSKTPVEVNTGDIVTYTIRIYNEGDISGYANEVTDLLPSGLKFLPDSTVNKTYGWKCYDGKTVTTDHLKDQLIESFNGTEIDYVDLQIECEVIEENSSARKTLKNVAEITKAKDENGNDMLNIGDDRDSTPNNLSDDQKQNYNPGESEKGWGYEDDDDYEELLLPGAEVDFSLRKFITAIGDTELKDENGKYLREPEVLTSTIEDTKTATYNHTKVPLTVKVGDIVTYTIRVYNEGDIDGYVSEITDHLPQWLEFVNDSVEYPEESDFNANYLWTVSTDGRTIKTTIISKDQTDTYDTLTGENRGTTLLEKWDGTENVLDYIDVKVKCKVIDTVGQETLEQGTKITNIADITGMTDSEGAVLNTDRDSKVNNVQLPSDEELPEYKQNEINSGRDYIEGQQDDDDFEKVIIQVFDLRLRKFITDVNDEEITDRYPVVSYKENVAVDSNILEYTHPKIESPVAVVKGDTVIYTIRIYNEGDIAGYAEEITDYLEDEGLKYLPDHETNVEYGWKMVDENGDEVTYVGEATKVVTDYLSKAKGEIVPSEGTGSDTNLNMICGFDKTQEISETNPDYRDVQIAFEVVEENESQRILVNTAEISDDSDYEGNPVTDIDSTPDRTYDNDTYESNGNGFNDEDDIDKDYLRLTCFDLALRKFITDVDGMPVNNRYPSPTWDNTLNRIVYDHPKTPVEVEYGDVVTYTIRVYNEGSQSGFAQEVTDDLPEYLTYLPDHEINQKYRWTLRDENGNVVDNVEDAVCVTTDYLSKENGEGLTVENPDGTTTDVNSNLLNAFSKEEGISDTNPDYRELKIAMRVDLQVTGDNLEDSNRILINEAQISEDADENGEEVKDIDSDPNRDDKYNYNGDNEDDIDYEPVKVKYFDLALKKWVTQAIVTESGKTTVTESGHTGDENPEPAMKVEIKSKNINKVNVKFKFSIKVTNQGEIAGYATEVTDHIPEGLEFVQSDNPNWYVKEGNLVATNALENTLLQPGESTTVEIVLQWINGNENFGLKTNYAEISEDYNSSNTPDIDSMPGNLEGDPIEDDEDEAPVVLSIKTGEAPMYFALTSSIIGMFACGVLMIKKYVI